jgi:hypothetical protein
LGHHTNKLVEANSDGVGTNGEENVEILRVEQLTAKS